MDLQHWFLQKSLSLENKCESVLTAVGHTSVDALALKGKITSLNDKSVF
jgi:hypothetical protein